jgi:hypothetical protein
MNRYAYMMAAALAFALAAGSAQARPWVWPNGVQLNGIPASGLAVETVQLANGTVVGR